LAKAQRRPPPQTPAPAPTLATDVPDPCLSDAQCKELYETARRQSEAGQHDAALINYQNAYDKKPAPWLLISIGRVHHKLQRFQLAITNYKKYLDLPAEATDAELRTKAEKYLEEAELQRDAQKGGLAQAVPDKPRIWIKYPIHKKWWFWTALGVFVAGAAVGIGVGVAGRPADASKATFPFPP
jgi:tetratricopeptide (TPR) repeat protein